MKGLNDYRKLMPVLMGVLLAGSIYGRVNAAHKDTLEYDDYLKSAREYRDGKIYATSSEEYQKALDMRESLELYCEIEQMLEEEGNSSKIESWCERLIEKYPNESIGYEYLINHYKELEDYSRCFEQYEIVNKRGIQSENIEDIIASIRYKYELDLRGYDSVSDFIAGYAVVENEGKYGLIAENGAVKLNNIYKDMSACDGSYVAVTDDNEESYYIDLEGDRRFNYPDGIDIVRIGKMYQDIIPVYTDNKMYYYTASDGIQIMGPYEDGGSFANGVAAVKEDGKWYLINTDGAKLTDAYEGFYMNSAGSVVSNGRVFANTGEGYLMLNENLETVSKTIYEDVRPFADDTYAAVKKDGKWGFIDINGNFVIKPTYEDAFSFCNGLAPVYESGLWGYIDTNGRWAIEPIFTDATSLNSSGCGFVIESDETKWSLIKFVEFNY